MVIQVHVNEYGGRFSKISYHFLSRNFLSTGTFNPNVWICVVVLKAVNSSFV